MPAHPLLDAIRAHPHEDTPRLVYADWLLERGDLLGELILLEHRRSAPARVHALYGQLARRILGDLWGHVRSISFRLGFLDQAEDLGSGPIGSLAWSTISSVRTSRADLVAQHAATLQTVWLDGWEPFVQLLTDPHPRPLKKIWPWCIDVLPGRSLPAAVSGGALGALTHLALAGFDGLNASDRGQALLALAQQILARPIPLEVLRMQTARPPSDALLEQWRAHPTLQRVEWIDGGWLRDGELREATLPVLPQGTARAGRQQEPPDGLVLLYQPRAGLHPDFWLARTHGGAALLVYLPRSDGATPARAVDGLDLGTAITPNSAPQGRVYASGAPLGPAPWDAGTIAAVRAQIARASAAMPGLALPKDALSHIVRRESGDLVLLAAELGRMDGETRGRIEVERQLASHVPGRCPWAAMTSCGSMRSLNEDAWQVHESGIWVVVDGMGGHSAGDDAASAVVDAFCQPASHWSVLVPEIRNRLAALERGAGATAVRLAIEGTRAEIAWIGDCRAYLLREGRLSLLTRDHSLMNTMVQAGRITPGEALDHPHRFILMRTFHALMTDGPEEIVLSLQPGDRIVLLSDGVWGAFDHFTLTALLLASNSIEESVTVLIDEADRCYGGDNATALIVTFEG